MVPHEKNIICSKTRLDGTTHEQTIICRQLFAGHLVDSRPIDGKEKSASNDNWVCLSESCLSHDVIRALCYWALMKHENISPSPVMNKELLTQTVRGNTNIIHPCHTAAILDMTYVL